MRARGSSLPGALHAGMDRTPVTRIQGEHGRATGAGMKGMRRWYTLFMIAMVAAIAELYGVGDRHPGGACETRPRALGHTGRGRDRHVAGRRLISLEPAVLAMGGRWRAAHRPLRRRVCHGRGQCPRRPCAKRGAIRCIPHGRGRGNGRLGPLPGRSMIADLYPLSRRATALAVVRIRGHRGGDGRRRADRYFADTVGWRPVFWTLGGVALVLALALRVSVPEPRRGVAADGESDALPLRAALQDLRGRRTFRTWWWRFSASASVSAGRSPGRRPISCVRSTSLSPKSRPWSPC